MKVMKNRPQDSPKFTRARQPPKTPPRKSGPRKLFVMRHGERPDFILGRSWFEESFDDNGKL